MRKIIFYNKNNNLCSRYFEYEYSKDNVLLKTKITLENYEKIVKNQDKISNIYFSKNNILFYVGDLKVVLVNKDNFKAGSLYKIIMKKVKEKKFKLIKMTKSLATASLVLTLIGGIVIPIKNNIVNAKVIPSDYSTEQTEEVLDSDVYYLDDHKEDYDKNKDILNNTSVLYEDSKKHMYVLENYGDIIDKYSNIYNIDSNVISAIATQERGVHSNKIDKGGAIGLMQIQVSVWNNKNITVYNNETNKYETINITLDKLKDVDFNIKVGCAIFQNCLKKANNNTLVAIQMYNMGTGTINKILNKYSKETGKTRDEILNNIYDTGWLDYRNGYNGDSKYVEHVARYISNNFNINETSIKA